VWLVCESSTEQTSAVASRWFVRSFFFMPHRHRPMTYHAFRSHLAAVHVGSGGAGGGVISIR